MAGAAAYLIVHDGSETKDADMDIVLLAHQAGVLQGPAPRKSAVPVGEAAVGQRSRSANQHPDSRLSLISGRRGGKRALHHQPRERGCGGRALSRVTCLEQAFTRNYPGPCCIISAQRSFKIQQEVCTPS